MMLSISSAQLYNNIQISVLGIAVVLGFFLLWRILRRIEERISAIPGCKCPGEGESVCFAKPSTPAAVPAAAPAPAPAPATASTAQQQAASYDEEDDEDEDDDEESFSRIFGEAEASAPVMVITTRTPPPPAPKQQGVIITEEPEEEAEEAEEVASEAPSAAASASGGLKRTALYRMSVDTLRDLAEEKGVSAEGTKKQVLDRLLALM